jgi:SAM-dependent methyltransferase
MNNEHAQFAGSIPAAYDRYLGHVLFQPYAEELAARLQVPKTGSVLELACGTGIVTRELRNRLPATVQLIATDLNEPMFQHAAVKFAQDDVVDKTSGASRADETAIGLVQGNPVSIAIAERDPTLFPVITNAIAAALKSRFGEAELRAPLRAIVVQAQA